MDCKVYGRHRLFFAFIFCWSFQMTMTSLQRNQLTRRTSRSGTLPSGLLVPHARTTVPRNSTTSISTMSPKVRREGRYISQSQRVLYKTISKNAAQAGLPADSSSVNETCSEYSRPGTCVEFEQVDMTCWDKDIEETGNCDINRQVCCVDRPEKLSLDDLPCGTTGSSIRSPRRLRVVSDPITKDVCWMAYISILRNRGDRQYMCDAVIFNSTHVITPSECIMKLRKVNMMTIKKILVTIGQSVNDIRQSLDFSQPRCGQEYSLDNQATLWTDPALVTVVQKGYALIQISEPIQPDACTCRACLPSEDDFLRLTTESKCYVSGFMNNAPNLKAKKTAPKLDLLVYRTNLITSGMCQSLLAPQKLPQSQVMAITGKLLCGVSPDVSGYCQGGMGGSLTCSGDYDDQQFLIGLSIQPVDCYTAPRLFRNIVGCYGTLMDNNSSCLPPPIALAGQNQCGRPKTNVSVDLFGLGFQTPSGTAKRALNIGRRMQMLSSFPVSDAALMGRSGFSGSEISLPGLHVQRDQLDVCWEVAVINPVRGHCSGVLITSRHVLTAAHCFTERNGSTIQDLTVFSVSVGFNSIPRESQRDCEVTFKLKKVRVHPLYSKPSGTRFFDLNDAAIAELDGAVDLDNNECACTICLDSLSNPLPGELCTLSGFGCPVPILANEICPAPRPWSLSWANVIILGEEVCAAIPNYPAQAMTCTVTDGGPSGCYGDSGGPLVCFDQTAQRHYLTGIFSFLLSTRGTTPEKCRIQPLIPNFYTKVSNYVPWLVENVAGLAINV